MNICVTGVGVVSAIGRNVRENLLSLRNKQTGIGPITLFPTELNVPAGEVKYTDHELKNLLGIPERNVVPRTALLAIAAVKEAVEDAHLDDCALRRAAFVSATSVGGMDLSERIYPIVRENPETADLRYMATHDCGSVTRLIAGYTGLKGYLATVSTACSSAANALMLGARLIRAGWFDTVVAGGTDALCRFTLNGFNSLKILDENLCRPFDKNRNGLNLGEGAGYLVLQAETSVRRPVYCRLSGYANTNEAFHQTGSTPEGEGAFCAMQEALRVAGLLPEQVDYVNVHGTGTLGNDLSESCALLRLFGRQVPPFSSVKSFIGHTLGASDGIEAVYSALAIRDGLLYPEIHFATPMPETGLIPVTEFKDEQKVRCVLSNAFGFGGNDTSLVFTAP